MKIGPRKMNLEKSIKARTTGPIKRRIKRSFNPFYGKKGMGWLRNPKKALYNTIYRRTTFSTNPLSYLGRSRKKRKKSEPSNSRWLLFIILIILAYYVLK
ncbi:hypothetical protein [Facklamia hominis]|uniref:Phage protein n=1 Tax=Facklamia hominis CCUG 36813 TaxID=883111 RepID=K1LXN7_9LACT|nr:hypothetical protein [Facklamia hominis]EKB54748.1 hypothetical protein HMPREF9706_00938 [Facklamia hominis CCUG 36813]EPH07774.1 hypothetical protein HMPREF9260_01773 [Facklamia hominis ACS-120-V-Sch10]WPJ91008.1 hypothetical protein R0V13_01030 [Facklamia hominis]